MRTSQVVNSRFPVLVSMNLLNKQILGRMGRPYSHPFKIHRAWYRVQHSLSMETSASWFLGNNKVEGLFLIFLPNMLSQKVKLSFNSWSLEPWACFLMGPGEQPAWAQKKAPKVLPRLAFSCTLGLKRWQAALRISFATVWGNQAELEFFVGGCQTNSSGKEKFHLSLVPSKSESSSCIH